MCASRVRRSAYFAEFWPILVADAMNNSGPEYNQQATLWNFEHVFGWVTTSGDVIAALQGAAREAMPAGLFLRRHRARRAIGADGDIGENALGHGDGAVIPDAAAPAHP